MIVVDGSVWRWWWLFGCCGDVGVMGCMSQLVVLIDARVGVLSICFMRVVANSFDQGVIWVEDLGGRFGCPECVVLKCDRIQ